MKNLFPLVLVFIFSGCGKNTIGFDISTKGDGTSLYGHVTKALLLYSDNTFEHVTYYSSIASVAIRDSGKYEIVNDTIKLLQSQLDEKYFLDKVNGKKRIRGIGKIIDLKKDTSRYEILGLAKYELDQDRVKNIMKLKGKSN